MGRLPTRSHNKVFSLFRLPWACMERFREACSTRSSDNLQLVQCYSANIRKKLSEKKGFSGQELPASEDKQQGLLCEL